MPIEEKKHHGFYGKPSRHNLSPGQHVSPLVGHIVAGSAEFVGTFMFLFLGYSGNIMAVTTAGENSLGGGISSSTIVFTAMAYGFSLLINVWAFYRVSGGLFNPAVSQELQRL